MKPQRKPYRNIKNSRASMLVLSGLVLLSFLFPPAWLAVFSYAIYLYKSKEARRDRVLLSIISGMIQSREDQRVIKFMHYDTAKKFAAAHGAQMSLYKDDPEDDTLIFDFTFNSKQYSICLQRWQQDDVLISVGPTLSAADTIAHAFGEDSEITKLIRKQEKSQSQQAQLAPSSVNNKNSESGEASQTEIAELARVVDGLNTTFDKHTEKIKW